MITTTTVSQEHKNRVTAKIQECIVKAEARYKMKFDMPTILYHQIGRTAGWAKYSTYTIELNADFFNNGHVEDMINNTAVHEFAHLVTHKVYGGNEFSYSSVFGGERRSRTVKPHGNEWKSVMRGFGLDPERCHDYNLEGVKTKGGPRIEYTCNCGKTFEISRTIHNRILMGNNRFCKRCRSQIWLKSGPKPQTTDTLGKYRHVVVPLNPEPVFKKEVSVQDILSIPMPEVRPRVVFTGEINVPRSL
jgi:SprT protein